MSKTLLPGETTFTNVGDAVATFGGFGRFQQILSACFSMMIMPGTFATLIMYFGALKPTWRCATNSSVCNMTGAFPSDDERRCSMQREDWEFTEHKSFSIVTQFDIYCEQEWIVHLTTSVLFIGWMFGAVILGWVSDNYGRKLVIFPSYFIIMVVGLIAAFSPSVSFLVVCRIIIGFFTPGSGVQSVVLLSEFVSTKYRPHAVTIVWFFFSLALVVLPLKSYLLMDWKLLFIMCTAPYLFIMLFYKFIPESVRWLHLHGHNKEMQNIFQRMGYWNKKPVSQDFNVLPMGKNVKPHKANPLELFRPRNMAISTLAQGFIWLVNGMVYYGLSLAADDLGGSLYTNFALVSAIEFPGNIVAMYSCDKIGRKKSTWISMLIGGIACIIVAFIPTTGGIKIFRIILGLLGKLAITSSFAAIYVWSVELYSTDIRAEGMGFLQITSRIGAASSPWIAKGLKHLHGYAPFIVMGVLSLVGAVLCYPLPETNGVPIKDTAGDENITVLEEKAGSNETEKALIA